MEARWAINSKRAWEPFARLAERLERNKIDPSVYIDAVFAACVSGDWPYPNALAGNWAWTEYQRRSMAIANRYRDNLGDMHQEFRTEMDKYEKELVDGLATYQILPVKDLWQLANMTQGVLPAIFYLIDPTVRRGAGKLGGVIAEAWAKVGDDAAVVARLDYYWGVVQNG